MAKKVEIAQRLQAVKELILSGVSYSNIMRKIADEYSLSERQARHIISQAGNSIKDDSEQTGLCNLAFHLESRRKLIEKCYQLGEIGTALKILRDMALLQGYYPEQKDNGDKGRDISIIINGKLTQVSPIVPLQADIPNSPIPEDESDSGEESE